MIRVNILWSKSKDEEEVQVKKFKDMSSAITWCVNNHEKILRIGSTYTLGERMDPLDLLNLLKKESDQDAT